MGKGKAAEALRILWDLDRAAQMSELMRSLEIRGSIGTEEVSPAALPRTSPLWAVARDDKTSGRSRWALDEIGNEAIGSGDFSTMHCH